VAHISRLRLTDFRNYRTQDVEFSGRPVVLYGANGSGKTNLLEALSLLSPGRGLRHAKVSHLARRIKDGQVAAWGVNADLVDHESSVRLAVGQVPEYSHRRTVRIDGRAATGTELAEYLSLIWLIPAQDRLFKGPASDRRKLLDRFSLAHYPHHGTLVLEYEKARAQRNRLLADDVRDGGWYDAYETTMAESGAWIAANRVDTLNRLVAEIDAGTDSVFPKSTLALDGITEELCQSGLDPDDLASALRDNLVRSRDLDRRAGRTLSGVHGSDLCVTYADKNMAAADCSTGEQKALLTGLILAQARTLSRCSRLILLDEIVAHLDENWRAALIRELTALSSQVFMTGTEAYLFEAFDGCADVYEVSNGNISPR